jgi:predicted dehydrogenase
MHSQTRRGFVSAIGAAAVTSASAWSQVSGANERLRIGVVGCGGMANGHMRALLKMKEEANIEIAAVCDVYEKRAAQAAQLTGGKAYKDYRTLLGQKEIDYVLIATPEHWHCQMTLDAADAGKHIYCEKPMTHSVEEAKKVVAKIRQTGVKMQVGVQGMSDNSYETAYEYVKRGDLGKVVLAQIDYSRNYKGDFWTGPMDEDIKPGVNLDWNAWLGHTPRRNFDPERYFHWRRYWDYSSGIASDLFVHRVTRIIKALGLTFPDEGVGMGGKFFFTGSPAEIPDTFNILLNYAPGVTVQLVSSMANDSPIEHMLRGSKATLYFTRTGFTVRPQALHGDPTKEVTFEKTGAEDIALHHRNLQDAIRHNEPLKCDCMLGYQGVVACQMGVESYRKKQYMAWDKTKERLVKA